MITKEQAMSFHHRQILLSNNLKDSKGQPVKCRVNGKCKTWKRVSATHPEGDFILPVKYGVYSRGCFYITPNNANRWTAE